MAISEFCQRALSSSVCEMCPGQSMSRGEQRPFWWGARDFPATDADFVLSCKRLPWGARAACTRIGAARIFCGRRAGRRHARGCGWPPGVGVDAHGRSNFSKGAGVRALPGSAVVPDSARQPRLPGCLYIWCGPLCLHVGTWQFALSRCLRCCGFTTHTGSLLRWPTVHGTGFTCMFHNQAHRSKDRVVSRQLMS